MPETVRRLKSAWHELSCWECRVTWTSFTQRLIGMKRGHTPKLSKQLRALVERAERAERSAEAWEADARRYSENADYWRNRAETADIARGDS